MKTIIELGRGNVSIDRGTFGGVPAVFIEPVEQSGVPGEKGPDLPLDSLRPGTVILEIHDQRGADVLAENLAQQIDWTQESPTEQAWYWHWNGNTDDAPFIYSVMVSGTNGKCFVANSSIAQAPWCAEVGGWWKKVMLPTVPNAD